MTDIPCVRVLWSHDLQDVKPLEVYSVAFLVDNTTLSFLGELVSRYCNSVGIWEEQNFMEEASKIKWHPGVQRARVCITF